MPASLRKLPLVGSIATMPTRAGTFPNALASILPQVDRLYVFLDGFGEVPGFLRAQAKCHPVILAAPDNLHASSRFLAPAMFGEDAVILIFDDDILYPPGYVATLVAALAERASTLVGYHAARFQPPHASYVRDRQILPFNRETKQIFPVHELGCGTLGFRSADFAPDPHTWLHHDMDDLYVAAEACRADLDLESLPRPPRWIRALAANQPDSLWRQTLQDDRRQSALMRFVMAQTLGRVERNWWFGQAATTPRGDPARPVLQD